MFAKIIATAAVLGGNIALYGCAPGSIPTDGYCLSTGGLPHGGCRTGLIPDEGGLCQLGGTRGDL